MSKFNTTYFEESVVRTAVGGCCHDFAIALHRRTGWPILCLWQDSLKDEFSLSHEPTPIHVFCVAPDNRVVDAEGATEMIDLVDRYCRHERDLERVRIEVHGTEADWKRVTDEVTTARTLAPREHGIAGAERVISGSASFLELVESLLVSAPTASA